MDKENRRMISKVICFASAKGGTGKTVTAAGMARLLGGLGKKVLLIDMDASTSGLSLLYLDKLVDEKKKSTGRGIFEITAGESPTPFEIYEGVDLIPTAYVMTDHIVGDQHESERATFDSAVAQTLRTFRDKYDYMVFDTQAGSNIYALTAIANADETVIVTEYDAISSVAVERIKYKFSEVLPLERMWILVNKVLPEFSSQLLSDFLRAARYLNPIPWDRDVVLALINRELAIDMKKGNDYTLAMVESLRSLLGSAIEKVLADWVKNKAEILRKPVLDQVGVIEKEISSLHTEIIEHNYRLRNLRRRSDHLIMSLSFAIGAGFVVPFVISYFLNWEILSREFVIILMAVALPLPLFATSFWDRLRARSEQKERYLLANINSLELKLSDLTRRREKYKIIAESDLNTLIRRRRELDHKS